MVESPTKPQTQSDDVSTCLGEVLADPKLLAAFESFLRHTWSHENLLFIEAMAQLRHETDAANLEDMLNRIYKTFIAEGAPLMLNVTTRAEVKEEIESLKWSIINTDVAVSTLHETEKEVLAMLTTKLHEFTSTTALHKSVRHNPCRQQLRVAIIGGGFTGFTVASILDPMPLFHVTLIDTKDSFEYTPGIVRKIVNPAESSSMRVRHDAYVRNGKVIIGYAEAIGEGGHTLRVSGETISFDYLVIATGSAYSSQLKSTDVSSLYRLNGLEDVSSQLNNAKKVLVIGGGLVGCELASEIAMHRFPGKYPRKKVTLVESHSNVISRSEPDQREKAREYLVDLGIEVVCNERIMDLDNGVFIGTSGRLYSDYDKVFTATGTRPNGGLLHNSSNEDALFTCLDDWGRIRVRPTLQVEHYKYRHIFAGGDVTNVVEEKTGYAATLAGVCIARNICRLVKGKEPLRQGTKGTLPAPDKPLHGITSQGGIGKQRLTVFKKKFAFLNPSWAALKYFDEQQYLRMVQGEAMSSSNVIGRLPRRLTLPPNAANNMARPQPVHSTSSSTVTSLSGRSSSGSSSKHSSSSASSLEEFLYNHFTFMSQHYSRDGCSTHTQSSKNMRRSSMPSIYSTTSDQTAYAH